jgi:hypothetical protein
LVIPENRITADIKIIIESIEISASLELSSEIGRTIFNSLPITARFERWGDEICFPLGLEDIALKMPVSKVRIGDIAYSEQWKSFCIFYGKTPLSNEFEIIPNGPVEIIGRLLEDKSALILRRFFSTYFTRIRKKAVRLFSISDGFAETITLQKS